MATFPEKSCLDLATGFQKVLSALPNPYFGSLHYKGAREYAQSQPVSAELDPGHTQQCPLGSFQKTTEAAHWYGVLRAQM